MIGRRQPHSLALLLTFAELAWILLLSSAFYFAETPAVDENAPDVPDATREIAALRLRLSTAETILKTERQAAKHEIEQLQRQGAELAAGRDRLGQALEAANTQLAQANSRQATLEKHAAKLEQELRAAGADSAATRLALAKTAAEMAQVRLEVRARQVIPQEIVGLRGRMRRVVFVFDTSGSMKHRDGTKVEDRWHTAVEVVRTWLGHLPIEQCALLLFSDDVRCFPSPFGAYLPMSGPTAEANRRKLLAVLDGVQPKGDTNTPLALESAYRYPEVDTIILFTDGHPDVRGRELGQLREAVYALAAAHPRIPVNTVGLGRYYDSPDFSKFLLQLAHGTGGTFIGR